MNRSAALKRQRAEIAEEIPRQVLAVRNCIVGKHRMTIYAIRDTSLRFYCPISSLLDLCKLGRIKAPKEAKDALYEDISKCGMIFAKCPIIYDHEQKVSPKQSNGFGGFISQPFDFERDEMFLCLTDNKNGLRHFNTYFSVADLKQVLQTITDQTSAGDWLRGCADYNALEKGAQRRVEEPGNIPVPGKFSISKSFDESFKEYLSGPYRDMFIKYINQTVYTTPGVDISIV